MSLQYIANQFSGISRVYIENPNQVKPFYPLSFHEPEAFELRRREIEEGVYERERLSKILYENNRDLEASEESLSACRLIENSKSMVVVTGQQAGLATGPLFTLYKAARAITLAKELSKKWLIPVVPVFWIASEDHDFEEISSVNLFVNEKLKKLTVEKPDTLKRSVGDYHLSDQEDSMLSQIIDMIGDQVYSEEMKLILSKTYKRGEGYGQWFARLILHLFRKQGLIVVDPLWPDFRRMQSAFFQNVIGQQEAIQDAFYSQTKDLEAEGYTPAIVLHENHSNLFMYVSEERLALKYDAKNQRYWVDGPNGEMDYTIDEVTRIAREEPTALSTNVVLRPVVQEVLFPVVSYVGGPGEIAYHAQLTKLYGYFNRKMPIMLPRLQMTVIPHDMCQSLEQMGLDITTLMQTSAHEIENQLLSEKDEIGIERKFEVFQNSFEKEYESLVRDLDLLHPEMKDLITKNQGMIQGQINYLYEKAHSYHRRQNKDLLKRFSVAQQGIKPMGEPQERILNFIPFYTALGPKWIEKLIDFSYDEMRHVILCEDGVEA